MRNVLAEPPGPRFLCPRCKQVRPVDGVCPTDGVVLIHDRTGQRLVDRYEYRRPLGRGAMGLVWEAEQLALHRKVAIKLTPVGDEDDDHRFTRGASIMATMSHPHIAAVHDQGEALGPNGPELFVVMERLQGAPLARMLARGPLAPGRVVVALAQTLGALEHVHRRGYVHRDVKPANLFVTALEEAPFFLKLLDFGIARQADRFASVEVSPETQAANRGHVRVTQPMRILGTPEYMAPEQILGGALDHRVDLYAVGVMAFLLLTGRLPLVGPDRHATYTAHLRTPPPRLGEVLTGAGVDAWDAWLQRALAKDRARRFESATEMREALLLLPPLEVVGGGA